MSIFNRARVYVNDVEVSHSPVKEPVRVEIEEPLPPLPMRSLPPFTEHPGCAQCSNQRIDWAYWPGYHDGCTTGFVVWAPYGIYFGAVSPERERDERRKWDETMRLRATMPRHHDLRCTRCHHGWAIEALSEGAA